jgi:hypothetical protein
MLASGFDHDHFGVVTALDVLGRGNGLSGEGLCVM